MPLLKNKVSGPLPSTLRALMPKRRKLWLTIIGSILALLILACVSAYSWYQYNTDALARSAPFKLIKIKAGDTAEAIAGRLAEQQLIRSELAFKIALRLDGRAAAIKSGAYRLSASETVPQIINKLASGQIDATVLQVSPGISLKTVQKQIVQAGFETKAVEAALAGAYDHPLLKDKPAKASLEGYLFPDTYFANLAQPPEAVVTTMFDTLYQKIQQNDLLAGFTAQGLNLHQAIILASLIENEVSGAEDRAHVAQIFLKRLKIDMPLGSDASFVYAAQQMGIAAHPDIDSPYNTRIAKGLPPGPVSNVSLSSLVAIAHPLETDDLYFVSGDDGINYFSKTLAEHEENVAKHCHKKCQL